MWPLVEDFVDQVPKDHFVVGKFSCQKAFLRFFSRSWLWKWQEPVKNQGSWAWLRIELEFGEDLRLKRHRSRSWGLHENAAEG